MKSGNRIIFGIGAAILGATLMSSFAHAAEGDDPGGTGGTGCGSYNHTGGNCSVVWLLVRILRPGFQVQKTTEHCGAKAVKLAQPDRALKIRAGVLRILFMLRVSP